ncbi:MAG: hypothetical protein ACSLE6_02085 [Mycobacterium sp.]
MNSVAITVSGMTCGQCAASVREEIATIKAAVQEAGYRLNS